MNPPRMGRRPVFIADYQETSPRVLARRGASRSDEETQSAGVITAARETSAIRYNFPAAGEEREGGTSDGYCYRITFAAGRLEATYAMVKTFLSEQGYGDVPLPADAAELRLFRQPPKLRHQLSFFGDNGYVHNPVKILFPVPAGHRGALIVELYDEGGSDHLLKFHRLK